MHHKDEVLNKVANSANVAQFVSFGPDLTQRFARVQGFAANYRFKDLATAVGALLRASPEMRVNIRSYKPEQPQASAEFIVNLSNVSEIVSRIRGLGAAGLYTIVNESINVDDGGVSGVLLGDVVEFAPGQTPRCVEGGDAATLPRVLGLRILETVYGFRPALRYAAPFRVEFSVHPGRRGYRGENTIIWEVERTSPLRLKPRLSWPHAFSRMLGDKTYGLLVAHVLGFHVPRTEVVCRRVAPFSFGRATDTRTKWLRTSPKEPSPGKFASVRGWTDPFALMNVEDRDREIASMLIQDEVPPVYSGALVTTAEGGVLIEGVRGTGDRLMMGKAVPQQLPSTVEKRVRDIHHAALRHFDSIRAEWVYDGRVVWVLQLQTEPNLSSGTTVVAGEPHTFRRFDVSGGIAELRQLVERIAGKEEGIILVGRIGMTSHMADLLRRARIPSRLVPTYNSDGNGRCTTSSIPAKHEAGKSPATTARR